MRIGFMRVAALAAGLAVSQVAGAADLAVHMPTKAPPTVAARTWTGCYMGVNIGVGFEHTDVNDEAPPHGLIAALPNTNVVGGGQIGCDYQFADKWVVGIQGMFDGTGFSTSATGGPFLGGLVLQGSIPWYATATGRLGYVVAPDWLVYVKGGGAWDHVDTTLVGIASTNFDLAGWTAGGGAEWMFATNWSVFFEYDYMGFNDKTIVLPGNVGTVHQNIQTALVGLNFHFAGLMH